MLWESLVPIPGLCGRVAPGLCSSSSPSHPQGIFLPLPGPAAFPRATHVCRAPRAVLPSWSGSWEQGGIPLAREQPRGWELAEAPRAGISCLLPVPARCCCLSWPQDRSRLSWFCHVPIPPFQQRVPMGDGGDAPPSSLGDVGVTQTSSLPCQGPLCETGGAGLGSAPFPLWSGALTLAEVTVEPGPGDHKPLRGAGKATLRFSSHSGHT